MGVFLDFLLHPEVFFRRQADSGIPASLISDLHLASPSVDRCLVCDFDFDPGLSS